MKLKRIINFIKKSRKKIKNQNNNDQIEKHNTTNLNWMMKLKSIKIFIKELGIKTRNPRSWDHVGEHNTCSYNFRGKERKKECAPTPN